MGKRVTSTDVAVASGVSQATVSYVLNDTPGQSISDATRRRVLRAAEELGYVPSSAGRTLRRGSSQVVLLDLSDIPEAFELGAFVGAFGDLLRRYGYIVTVFAATGGEQASLEELAQALAPAAVVRVDPPTAEQVAFLRRIGVPQIAWADFELYHPHNQQLFTLTARTQVEHLVETGRRSIAYVLPSEPALGRVAADCTDAARERAHALGVRAFRVLEGTDTPERLGAVLAAALADGIDGLACFSDAVAFRVLGVLHSLGVPVPERVGVIGVDDSPLAPWSVPPLTSVRVAPERFGADMAARVLRALGHDVALLEIEELAFSVTRRAST